MDTDKQKTTGDLLLALQAMSPSNSLEVDTKNIKYIIYARKSTRSEERQEKSIDNQIDDCIDKVVNPYGLTVIGEPIRESCSAKDPDIRPLFREMLDSIKAGNINGIIAWHPDRLSRNMKEAGEIIDLLDKGVLKDLRFATSAFENSPTGKMLLGISFVLSKQYSEHLSESVLRGNKYKVERGDFISHMKLGYYINDDKLLTDGNNFILIKQAFQMRLNGKSLVEIAKMLNSSGLMVRKRGNPLKPYKSDKDSVSKMLRDPTYAGVLKHGGTLFSDIVDAYGFEPAISVDDFMIINKITDLKDKKILSSLRVKSRDSIKADLLRGIVFCIDCNKALHTGITSKKLKSGVKNYYYFRCETDGCLNKNKSIRAKVIIQYAIDFLSNHLFTTRNNYLSYLDDAKEFAQVKNKEISGNIAALTRIVGDKQAEYDQSKAAVRVKPELATHYDLDTVKQELKDLKVDLSNLYVTKKELTESKITYAKYLELFENISVKLSKNHDMAMLDQILRKFFSNFTIKSAGIAKQQGFEINHKLNEPWNGFVQSNDFEYGRGDRT